MAFPTYVTPDPMGNFAAGNRLAQGQAEMQMRQQALQAAEAQRAIDAAKEKKANDFNQMFSLLQFGAAQTNRQQDLAMRQQEMQARLGMQNAELDRQGRLDSLAERRVAAYEQSLQDRGNSSADAVMATLISGQAPMAAPAPDAMVPMPQAVGDVAPSAGDFGEPVLPDALPGAVQEPLVETPPPPEGLFPGPDLGAEGPAMPPGPPGQPGVPDALLMQDIQGTGATQGAEPPPSFATSDPGVSRWLRESEDIQTDIRTAAAARQEAASRASQIRALLPRVKDPSLAARAAAEYGKLARQDAEQQATVQAKEGDLKAARLNAERAQRVQATMQTLAPLDNVLPAGDMARITKSLENAGDLPDTAPPVRQLADLAKYQEVRSALNMTAPSNGIATAREVVRAYEALQSDDVVQSRNAAALLAALKEGVPTGEFEGGRPVRKKPATTDPAYETWIKNINDLDGKAQAYRSAVTRAEAAMEGDTRRPDKKETAAPAAQSAPAPAAQEAPKQTLFSSPTASAPAAPASVGDWWTTQKKVFSMSPAARSPLGEGPKVSLADFDEVSLKAAAQGLQLYKKKGGGVTAVKDEAEAVPLQGGGTAPIVAGAAAAMIAQRLGYDPKMVPAGGDVRQNTGNRWGDVTIADIVKEAAAEELVKRGKNGAPGSAPPVSPELEALNKKFGLTPK